MKDGKVFIWMNLLGFNRDDEDKGVERYLNQTGFIPEGISLLVCNVDFFNLHRGMDEEYVLPPDNCAYWGIPRNAERERQPWTNYDLRTLTENLKKKGTNTYASIFGNYMDSSFHREWIEDHKEIFRDGDGGFGTHGVTFVLKRFNDGTYYEDFFINKICQTLTDYGMKGVHFADNISPAFGGMMYDIDFSTDFVDQFLMHTKLTIPEEIMATIGDNSEKSEKMRSKYIYTQLRAEWIEFSAWRWEQFFKKLCSRLHAIDKEVTTLAMYCTDPFETLYCLGTDLRKIVEAGVDYITANILPAGNVVCGNKKYDPFYKQMAIASTTAAHIPKGKLVSMLGLHDATEEYSIMHHAPTRHERDLYTMMAYSLIDRDGTSRALDGYFLCLGDGLTKEDWSWERERLERGLSARAEKVLSPVMLWSEEAHKRMLREYIKTRRWTPHKHFYSLSEQGTMCGATIKPEGLKNHNGALLVPNIDMLPQDEFEAVLSYNGPVMCTASPDFDLSGIPAKYVFSDSFSNYSLKAFTLNADVSEEIKAQVDELLKVDDGTENLTDILNAKEPSYVLHDTLTFSKVTQGFVKAMALVLKDICDMPFKIDKPSIVTRQADGAYRLHILNDSVLGYSRAFVRSKSNIADHKTVTHFPILPPKWMETASSALHYVFKDNPENKHNFQIKIPPAGITVIDLYLKEEQ